MSSVILNCRYAVIRINYLDLVAYHNNKLQPHIKMIRACISCVCRPPLPVPQQLCAYLLIMPRYRSLNDLVAASESFLSKNNQFFIPRLKTFQTFGQSRFQIQFQTHYVVNECVDKFLETLLFLTPLLTRDKQNQN